MSVCQSGGLTNRRACPIESACGSMSVLSHARSQSSPHMSAAPLMHTVPVTVGVFHPRMRWVIINYHHTSTTIAIADPLQDNE
jgi:hypothetical protein